MKRYLLSIDLMETKHFSRPLSKLRFCRFSGSFEPLFDLNCGGNIDKSILPPQFKLKNGQNNPENRRTLRFERGLVETKSFHEKIGDGDTRKLSKFASVSNALERKSYLSRFEFANLSFDLLDACIRFF